MTKRSPREIEHEVEKLREKQATGDGVPEVGVEWREADPDARPTGMTWDAGGEDEAATLGYDLWGAQREALDAAESGDYDVTAFLAGFGAGKSVLGARWLLANAIEYPGSRFLCLAVDHQKGKVTTYPKLWEALPGSDRTALLTSAFNGPESSPLVADFNRKDYRLTLTNDSVIILGSADDYARYMGAEFGAAWLDEPSLYSDLHNLVDTITSRLRGVDGPRSMLWTLTGEGGYGAAYEILEERQNADGGPIGLDIEVVRASVLDNPYLPEGDLDRFRRKFEGTPKEDMALHGGFAAAQGLVYSSFDRDVHVADHGDVVDRLEADWRIFGYDAGFRDPRVVIEIGRTGYGQLVALDEFHERESHVEDAVKWVAADGRPTGVIYCEHVPADIERFRKAGLDAKKADKSIDAGIGEVRRRLEVDDEGRPGLLISDRCTNLIREILGYKEEHVGKSVAEDHVCDSLRYAVFTNDRRGGPVPTATARVDGSRGGDGEDGPDDMAVIDEAVKGLQRKARQGRGGRYGKQ